MISSLWPSQNHYLKNYISLKPDWGSFNPPVHVNPYNRKEVMRMTRPEDIDIDEIW